MKTSFKQISADDAQKFIKNYRATLINNPANKTTLEQFGGKVAEHLSRPTQFKEPFRTKSLSFTDVKDSIVGLKGLGMVISDLDQILLPPFANQANRYRIYLGLRDDQTRIDILALAKYEGGKLSSVGTYYEITPNDNVQYDAIVESAEAWDLGRESKADTSQDGINYSWHCEPHCPP